MKRSLSTFWMMHVLPIPDPLYLLCVIFPQYTSFFVLFFFSFLFFLFLFFDLQLEKVPAWSWLEERGGRTSWTERKVSCIIAHSYPWGQTASYLIPCFSRAFFLTNARVRACINTNLPGSNKYTHLNSKWKSPVLFWTQIKPGFPPRAQSCLQSPVQLQWTDVSAHCCQCARYVRMKLETTHVIHPLSLVMIHIRHPDSITREITPALGLYVFRRWCITSNSDTCLVIGKSLITEARHFRFVKAPHLIPSQAVMLKYYTGLWRSDWALWQIPTVGEAKWGILSCVFS